MSFREFARSLCDLSPESIRLWEDAQEFDLNSIERGVVLVFATCSGVAHLILKNYCRELAAIKAPLVMIHLLNHDSLSPKQMDTLFGGPQHGYCEAYFVKGGQVKASIIRPENDYVQRFLEAYRILFS